MAGSASAAARLPGDFVAGATAATPVVLGYLAIGFAAGVVARAAGLSVAEVGLMSLVLYAGSAQFIAASLVGAGAAAPTIVSTVFLVNLRHLLHSSSLAAAIERLSAKQSVLVGAELTDETFTVASTYARGGRPIKRVWMYGLNVTSHLTWVVANVAGALLGGTIPNPEVLGLDVALPAMFMALLVLQLAVAGPRLRLALLVAVLAAGLMLLLVHVVPGGVALLAATAAGATVGLAWESLRGRPAKGARP